MEDKRVDEFAEMADKRPRKAIIYLMGSLIIGLLAFAKYQDSKISKSQDVKDAALKEQQTAFNTEIALVRKECKDDMAAKDKKIEDYQNQIITRTDLFASTMTAHVQKQLDKLEKNDEKKLRLNNERLRYRNKDEINLQKLERENNQTNEN